MEEIATENLDLLKVNLEALLKQANKVKVDDFEAAFTDFEQQISTLIESQNQKLEDEANRKQSLTNLLADLKSRMTL